MTKRLQTLLAIAAFVSAAGFTSTIWARGGSGGGGGGGGGGHGAGAHGGGFGGGHGGTFGGHYGGHGWGGPGYRTWGGHGYGWGYRGRGWGYPAYGYGLGLGLGVGLGYGVGYGLSGGYGYGGYGYGGYDYGYPAYGYAYDPYGTGYTSGYVAGYGAASYPAGNLNAGASSRTSATALPIPPVAPANSARAPSPDAQPFVDRGEKAFRSGDYSSAAQAFRHAVVDDSQNGLIMLMLGQSLFAIGRYEEAAGATQAAMRQLPKEQWGVIISHYDELYGQQKDYTDQLHALEEKIKGKPGEPALRFLAGFHYAYLGFVTESVDQLEAGLKLAPRDEMARQLRNEMRTRLAKPTQPPASLVPGLPAETIDQNDE